jgi:hypothetical protein
MNTFCKNIDYPTFFLYQKYDFIPLIPLKQLIHAIKKRQFSPFYSGFSLSFLSIPCQIQPHDRSC